MSFWFSKKISSFLIIIFSFCSFFGLDTSSGNLFNKKYLQLSNSIQIENGGVYFIRSNSDNNKVFDISYGNYNAGTEIITYSFTGWENQRFILEESYLGTYRIKPLNCNGLYLGVENDDSTSGNKIVLRQEGQYDYNTLRTDRFMFVYDAINDAYKISTAISDYNKYIGTDNYVNSNNNNLVQKEYSSSNHLFFEWVLQKTETMQVNVQRTESYNTGQVRWFYLNLPYSMDYYVRVFTNGIRALVSLHEDDSSSTLLSSYDTINSLNQDEVLFLYTATAFQIKKLKIQNLSSYSGTISFYVYPKKSFAVTCMYDYGITSIDCVSVPLLSVPYLTNLGYYPYFQANMGRDNILQYGKNGKRLINSDYFFDIHHGNPGGTSYFDFIPGEDVSWIDITNMPSFSGTVLTYWGSCYSATTSQNHNHSNITSNLALRSVELGATYGVGFDGETLLIADRFFVSRLFYHLGNSESIMQSIAAASSETNSTYWLQLIFAYAIKTPIVYVRTPSNEILKYNGRTGELMQRETSIEQTVYPCIYKENVYSNLSPSNINQNLFNQSYEKYSCLFENNKKYALIFTENNCVPFECYFDALKQTLLSYNLLTKELMNEYLFFELVKEIR